MKQRVLFAMLLACISGSLDAPAMAKINWALVPTRMVCIGDSITVATHSTYGFPGTLFHNLPESNCVGYADFFTWLAGYTNVQSHNQRVAANFRPLSLNGYAANDGHDWIHNAQSHAGATVNANADYVRIHLSANDACQGSIAAIPTNAQMEAAVRGTLTTLRNGLRTGSVVNMDPAPNIRGLYDLGMDITFLGIIDCRVVWALTLADIFPCGSFLSPLNSEADRAYAQSRQVAFNTIMRNVMAEFNATDPNHWYNYSNAVYDTEFFPSDVSVIDCFHPSARGQSRLAAVSWLNGFFGRLGYRR